MLVDRSKYKYIDYHHIDEKQSNVGRGKKEWKLGIFCTSIQKQIYIFADLCRRGKV